MINPMLFNGNGHIVFTTINFWPFDMRHFMIGLCEESSHGRCLVEAKKVFLKKAVHNFPRYMRQNQGLNKSVFENTIFSEELLRS